MSVPTPPVQEREPAPTIADMRRWIADARSVTDQDNCVNRVIRMSPDDMEWICDQLEARAPRLSETAGEVVLPEEWEMNRGVFGNEAIRVHGQRLYARVGNLTELEIAEDGGCNAIPFAVIDYLRWRAQRGQG